MDPLGCVATNGAAIVAATTAAPDAPVPTCPGWTMTDLADHVAGVFAFATDSLLAPDGIRPPRPTDPGPAAPRLDRLLAVLDTVDPDALRPTLVGPRPVRWWIRRLHHETNVHRVDASPGVEPSSWLAAECAVDGIDEVVDVLIPVVAPEARVVATDGALLLGDDAAVAGSAVDRFLLLWGRRSLDHGAFTVTGDRAAAAAALATVRF
jgi:uncharacterized protein (TIGR03083 family)